MEKNNITNEEIESLKYYTSRKKDGILDLKGYQSVNKFIKKITKGKPDPTICFMKDYTEFKNYLKHIENILSLSCKYGATHDIPYRIFRGYNGASIVNSDSKKDKWGDKYWMSDQFLSCSTSESETRTFSDLETMIFETSEAFINQRTIPFIKTNDLLGSDIMFGDEKEIILPPFLDIKVNDTEITRYRAYYNLKITPFVTNQNISESLDKITDQDLKKYYDLSKIYFKANNNDLKKQIENELIYLTKKIKNHLHSKLVEYQMHYMYKNDLEEMFEENSDNKSNNIKHY